jgi:hypothetical protein
MLYLPNEGLVIIVSEVVWQYLIGQEVCVSDEKALAVVMPADSLCVLRIL